ncbi:hypothetical protein FOCC_FOCC002576 [Frankliniella occidentalis]|nr:hypothetical protein FOCC_FOCC002576 [Frankliniella occidentalis]
MYAMDVNVVSVDWSPLSAVPWYPTARSNVDVVGVQLAALLDWLATRGALPESMHLVGHSLGAHVAGVAGANIRAGKVNRISGSRGSTTPPRARTGPGPAGRSSRSSSVVPPRTAQCVAGEFEISVLLLITITSRKRVGEERTRNMILQRIWAI